MRLNQHREILPNWHPLTGTQRDAGQHAAQAELHECLRALQTDPSLYGSPRMFRRHKEAVQALDTYKETTP